jgi:hypothetical protein
VREGRADHGLVTSGAGRSSARASA